MGEMGSEGNKTQRFEDLSGYIDKSAFNQFHKEILDSTKILNGYIKYLHSPFYLYLFNYFTIASPLRRWKAGMLPSYH